VSTRGLSQTKAFASTGQMYQTHIYLVEMPLPSVKQISDPPAYVKQNRRKLRPFPSERCSNQRAWELSGSLAGMKGGKAMAYDALPCNKLEAMPLNRQPALR
jgi:hypothetical protein